MLECDKPLTHCCMCYVAGHMLDVGHTGEFSRGMSSPVNVSQSGHVTPQPSRSPQPNRIPVSQLGRGHPNLTVVIPNSRGEVPNSADQMVRPGEGLP